MINLILYPLAFGLLFGEFSGIPQGFSRWLAKHGIGKDAVNGFQYAKKLPYRLKPFDCGLCLTFWSSMAFNYLYNHLTAVDTIGYACINACLAYLIIQINARINR